MSKETIDKRTLNQSKGRGVVDPNLLYTTDALRHECRMKRDSIVEMRQKGGVKPMQIGTQQYYDGAEVKEYILKHGKRK